LVIHGFTGINGMRVNVGLISIIASITSSILPNDRRFDAMGTYRPDYLAAPRAHARSGFSMVNRATYG